jgi:hypothetical protein
MFASLMVCACASVKHSLSFCHPSFVQSSKTIRKRPSERRFSFWRKSHSAHAPFARIHAKCSAKNFLFVRPETVPQTCYVSFDRLAGNEFAAG